MTGEPGVLEGAARAARRRADARANFALLTLDGLFFWLGISFLSPTTILPLFVSHLTDSNVLVGLVPAVVAMAWSLPQLAGARALGRTRVRKAYIVRTAMAGRVALLALVVSTALFSARAPGVALALFFLCYSLFRVTGGLTTPVYYDLMSEVIDPRLRARFIGFNQFLGGAIGAGALALGREALDAFTFPTGFVICFAVGVFFVTTGLYWMAIVREPAYAPHRPAGPAGGRGGIVRAAGEVLGADAAFRGYLASRAFVAVASMAQAFYAVHATRVLGASDGDVALYSAVLLASQTVGTLLWGAAADRLGLRPVLLSAVGLGALATAAALLAPSLAVFSAAFALSGLSLGALAVTDPGLPLALAEARLDSGGDRGLYVAISNTVLAPVYMVAPLVGGAAADAAGYGATYVLAIAAGVIALALVAFFVRSQR